jgi:hypothetical protein
MDCSVVSEALEAVIAEAGEVTVPPQGPSMGPRYESARGLRIVSPRQAAISVGSVIAFKRHGRWIVHRVLWVRRGKEATEYLTKGDAVSGFDWPWVSMDQVVGVVFELTGGTRPWPVATPAGPMARELAAALGEWVKSAILWFVGRLRGSRFPR